MKLYLGIIGLALASLTAISEFALVPAFGWTHGWALAYVLIPFFAVVALDALIALIVHRLPGAWFLPDRFLFRVAKWERRWYEALGIKVWKDKIPETGGALAGFAKDKVYDKDNPEYLERFLIETGYAECMHFLSAALGFSILLLFWGKPMPMLCCALPIAIVNCMMQIPSAIIQRYNRPRLQILYRWALRTRKKEG